MDKTKLNRKNLNLKRGESPYKTLALADDSKTDPKTNEKIPSENAVERTRNWSIENKL